MRQIVWAIFSFLILQINGHSPSAAPRASTNEKNLSAERSDPIARFQFERNLDDDAGLSEGGSFHGSGFFVKGLDGQALRLTPDQSAGPISIDIGDLNLNSENDFSVQFWIRTRMDTDSSAAEESANLEAIERIRKELMANPYTVHQARSFMEVAPMLQIYSLVNGKVTMDKRAARDFSEKVRLFQPDFDMDNLLIWDRALSPEEVRGSYANYSEPDHSELEVRLTSFTAAVWNIYHGGKHFTVEKDGWDSRLRIAEMLKQQNADVIMMQETYSSGDFIAVPHTDGGKSPASLRLLGNGFTDAYRSIYPDIDNYPGFTHRSGSRIDQLYYKGRGLKNTSTRVVSTWEGGFPSDHFMIISQFDLR